MGKKSSRLLWRKKKDMADEKVQAMDTLYGLGEQIGEALKKKLFSEKTTFQKNGDLRQLFLMDKIYTWYLLDNFQDRNQDKNTVTILSELEDDKPWNDKENFDLLSDEINKYFKLNRVKSSDHDVMSRIHTDVVKIMIRECKIMQMDENKLSFEIPGPIFLDKLSEQFALTLEYYKDKVISIYSNYSPKKFKFDHLDIKYLYSLEHEGFGKKRGALHKKKISNKELTKHSCLKLAYNVLNELLDNKIIRNRKMDDSDYKNHNQNDDGSVSSKRERKRSYPNLLIFTDDFVKDIGNTSYENYKNNTLNAVFRWVKNERNKFMYCPPLRFEYGSNITKGGYLSEKKQTLFGNSEIYDSFGTPRAKPSKQIIDAINILQETQWEINLDLLEVISNITLRGDKKEIILDKKIIDKDGWICKIEIKDVFKDAFLRKNEEHHTNQERILSLSYCQKIIEHNANVFWHTWRSDFRGRLYADSAILSPQGSDTDKALIRFKEWKKLGIDGKKWLYIFIHNLFTGIENENWIGGPPKKRETFSNREKWVTDNIKVLRKIAKKPAEKSNLKILGLDTISASKSQSFQRLSSILELNRIWNIYEKGTDFSEIYSGLPIYLDASCNGYQHISALVRDVGLAKNVNIIPNKKNKIKDLYGLVADEAKEIYLADKNNGLRKILINNLSKNEMTRIKKDNPFFQRNLAKQPVMTTGYGSTDIRKSLIGGAGGTKKPDYIKLNSKWTKKELSRNEDLPKEIVDSYYDFKDKKIRYNEFADLSKKYIKDKKTKKYKLRSEGKETKNKSLKYLDEWEKILQATMIRMVWHPESPLYENIIKNNIGKELSEKFSIKSNGISKSEEEKNDIALLHREIAKHLHVFYSNSIKNVTKDVFSRVIEALQNSIINNHSEGFRLDNKYIDRYKKHKKMMKYDNIIRWSTNDGFIVRNYHIDTYQRDKKSDGMPTGRLSSYSSIDPDWYKSERGSAKNKYGYNSGPKSMKRIFEKMKEISEEFDLSGIKNLLKIEKHKTSDVTISLILDFLDNILENDNNEEGLQNTVLEIRRVVYRFSYSVPQYSTGPEHERLSERKFRKIFTSIMPNFIHSLDALHMRSVINEMHAEIPNLSFWSVHDAFGTHACEMQKLINITKEEFYEIHKDRDINWWLRHMRGENAPQIDINDEDWNSELIRDSEYMIY